MNEEQKRRLIMNISNFYMLFQKEILKLAVENTNLEFSPLLFKALHEIYVYGDITPSVLSKRLAISIPNTSRCLNKLSDLECIVKLKDEDDKRITHIQLSQKGLSLVEDSMKVVDQVLLNKFSILNSEELIKLSEAMGVLRDVFEKIGALNSVK